MKIAIYPGSFDPVTSGHLNIIRRASKIFDRLIVCVMVNAGKKPMFSQDERVDLIRRVTADLPNVEVDCSSELLAEYAKRKGGCVIVKGLRAGSDFEYEFQMALINKNINPELDTMFLTAEHQHFVGNNGFLFPAPLFKHSKFVFESPFRCDQLPCRKLPFFT